MRAGEICRVSGEPDWNVLPVLPIDTRLWCDPVEINAWAQIGYGTETLHVRLRAQETEIRAEETGPLGMPCEDSCLEFFFCPMENDGHYFNIEYNPNTCLYLGFGSADLTRLVPDGAETLFCPQVLRNCGGWEIQYRVSYSFIRRFFPAFAPVPGATMRANFFKCGDLTPKRHYFAWNPVNSDTPNFHRPQDFGLLRFSQA